MAKADDTELELWGSWFDVPLGNGAPITTAISADIVMSELGGFSASNIVLPGASRQAVETLRSFTKIEVKQIGVGDIMTGYVINPKRTITENDDHTINLELWPLTEELKWVHARQFQATTWLSIIYTRLRDKFFPLTGDATKDWHFNFIGPPDSISTVTLQNPKVLKACIDIAHDNNHYIRQGRNSLGYPDRILEIGQFGAAPKHWLSSANGADSDVSSENSLVRLVASIEHNPADATNMCNVTVPYGGGNDFATLVTVERLYRIINDPSYPNFGRYGTDADSISRTGQTSIFWNYDPNYPISDPRNPPTGAIQMVNVNGVINSVNESVIGLRYQDLINSGFVLYQGANNTRYVEDDGSKSYVMYDKRSYFGDATDIVNFPAWGHKEDSFVDSGLNFPDDSTVGSGIIAVQETTEMALYASTIAMFKVHAHPHHLVTCVADAIDFPTQAGDLISVDYQRIGADDDGAFAEMNSQIDLKVTKVVRSFPAMRDAYSLSNIGRFEEDDATDDVQQADQIQALQMKQGANLTLYPQTLKDNVDALNPLTMWILVPTNLDRWLEFRVRVDFMKYTATAQTADNPTGTQVYVFSQGQDILLDTGGSSVDLQGGTHNGTGYVSDPQSVPGIPLHFHQLPIYSAGNLGGGGLIPTQNQDDTTHTSKWTFVFSSGNVFRLTANNSGPGILETNGAMQRVSSPYTIDTSVMNHTGVTPLNKTIRGAFQTIARIAGSTLIGELPPHKHPLKLEIPVDAPTPAHCAMYVNGLLLPSKAVTVNGTRDFDGTFSSSFEILDIGENMNIKGAAIPLQFYSVADVSRNPTGAGSFQVTVLGVGQISGQTATTKFN